MCKVILISGKARAGKDTAANFIKEELESRGLSVLKVGYADYLKFICSEYFGCSNQKNEASRSIWQYIGTDVIRKNDPDFLVKVVVNLFKVLEAANLFNVIIVSDVRFPNEIEYWINEGYDVDTIRIVRTKYESELTPEQKQHVSETSLDNYFFDYCFIASTTEELLKSCKEYASLISHKPHA